MPMSHPAPREPVTLPTHPPDDLPRSDAGTRWLPKYAQDADRPYEGDPWSQQKPRESSLMFARFKVFLAIPPSERSLAEAHRRWCAEHPDKSCIVQAFQKASSVHRWSQRAIAFDNFEDARLVAAHRRRSIRAAEKHADQAAAIQDLAMIPVDAFKKRMQDALECDGRTFVDDLDEVSLMKLAKAFAPDLLAAQKAEREALSSTSGATVTPREIRTKGELVRKMLANKDLSGLMEKLSFETVEVVVDEAESG